MLNLNDLAKESFERAKRKGFYDPPPTMLERIALMHTEVSEAHTEGQCSTRIALYYEGSDKPEGFGIELADVVIRIADCCGYADIDLMGAFARASRPRFVTLHGLDAATVALHKTLSNAAEHFRKGELGMFERMGFWRGLPIEFGYAVRQCYQLAFAAALDLNDLIRVKSDYNETRPHKHGKSC